jgi:hypothetical protein
MYEQVWDVAGDTYECEKTLEGHTYDIRALIVSEDRLYSGCYDMTIKVSRSAHPPMLHSQLVAVSLSDDCTLLALADMGREDPRVSAHDHRPCGPTVLASCVRTIKPTLLGRMEQANRRTHAPQHARPYAPLFTQHT